MPGQEQFLVLENVTLNGGRSVPWWSVAIVDIDGLSFTIDEPKAKVE